MMWLLLFLWSQLPLTGVSGNKSAGTLTTPCDLVSGCAAAYSVDRKVVNTYGGSLFRLSRTGGTTQDIGFVAGTGLADTAAIAGFCGSAWPMGGGAGVNSCKYHIIYDQSGNGNDMTAVGGDVPFESDSVRNLPRVHTDTGLNYLNNAGPTNAPINGVDVTVSLFMNDALAPTSNTTFGLYHCVMGCALDAGSNFGAGTFAHKNFHAFGVDLEADSHQVHYAPGGAGGSLDSTVDPLGLRGDIFGISSYTASTKTILNDFNGLYVYSAVYSPGLKTTGSAPNQIRLGAGGDASQFPSIFYEGIIWNRVLSTGDRTTLQSNISSVYSVSLAPSCGAGTTIVDTLGRSVGGVQIQAYGLRVLDRQYIGPIAVLHDDTNNIYKAITNAGCNFDTATAATFCSGVTCSVRELFSQVMDPVGSQGSYGGIASDLRQMTQFSVAAPIYTASCLGSLPCMTFSSEHLDQNYNLDNVNSPYTFFAVANVTGGGGFQAVFGDANEYLGSGAANTTAYAQGVSSDGSVTLTMTNAFHGLADTANSATSMSIYVDGANNTNGSLTVTNTTGTMTFGEATAGNLLAGTAVEFERILGTAIGALTISTIQTNQKSYWGY